MLIIGLHISLHNVYKTLKNARLSAKFLYFDETIINFAFDAIKMAENMKDLNRIKVVLVEKKRTNKWLAEQLGKDPATISKWCTNTSQPDLATLLQVANLLEVDVKDLLNSSREEEFKIVRIPNSQLQ